MFKIATFLALAVYQVSARAVELLPNAPVAAVAPVAPALVTARSSQYFAQNHNAVAAPLVAPVTQYVSPASASVSQVTQYAAPFAQYVASPVAQYAAPVAASYSQFARYASPVAQYIAPVSQYVIAAAPPVQSAPLVQAFAVSRAAPLVAKAAPLVAGPVFSKAPLAVAPVALAQPVVSQQPGTPPVQAQNPDDETIEIESARVRTLPQARNQPQQNLARSQQSAPVARFQSFPQQNLAFAQQFSRIRQQTPQQNVESARFAAESVAQARNQQLQSNAEPSARNVAQQPQGTPVNGALVAAPGLLSNQQYIQGPYFG